MPEPISLNLDHVTIAGRDLGELRRAFTRLGLEPVHGGPHANGATHMDLLGFDDGTYIELISTLTPEISAPWWERAIKLNAGPTAWAIQMDNIQAESERLLGFNIWVRGLEQNSRVRPDGARVEWNTVFLGQGDPGSMLPFMIGDLTPRAARVQPSPSVSGSELAGIGTVVLGVFSMIARAEMYRRIYHWPRPEFFTDEELGAQMAFFPGQPVALAQAVDPSGPLARRLETFGETPLAFLIGTRDWQRSAARFRLGPDQNWAGTRLGWFDAPRWGLARIGLIEKSSGSD